MDCKVIGEALAVCACTGDISAEIPVDAEFTLPDYCPDIGKLLRCVARPELTVREVKNDAVRIEGSVRLNCLYIDGRDRKLRCCEHEVPFSLNVPVQGCTEGSKAYVQLRVDYINCRAASQRKLDIHGAVTAKLRVSAPKSCELLTGAECDGVRVHCVPVKVSEFVSRTQACFTVSESLELPHGKPSIFAVLRSDSCIILNECKPIANKLIIKGEAILKIVYCTDKGDSPETMEYTIPFNQFIDMTDIDDTSDIDIRLAADRTVLELRTDPDGEYRRVAADIHICADAAAYRERELSVMTDAYSVDCELALEHKRIPFERLAARVEGRCQGSCRVESGREITEVLDCWCEITSSNAECRGNRAVVTGTASACAIVRLADGDADYMEGHFNFESETAMPIETGRGSNDASAVVRGCTCNIAAANRIELRVDIDTTATLREENVLSCVSAVTPDENRPKSRNERPAVVMYFGEAGEELWNIAREYNASPEDIAADNDIQGDRLGQDRLMLIAIR